MVGRSHHESQRKRQRLYFTDIGNTAKAETSLIQNYTAVNHNYDTVCVCVYKC
jgi:hypothetical protein